MMVFPGMLVSAAERAGIKVPEDPDNDYDPMEFPHFHLFCCAQLGQSMPYAGVHWDNAKVIASIPEEKIMEVTYEDLKDWGFQIGFPIS